MTAEFCQQGRKMKRFNLYITLLSAAATNFVSISFFKNISCHIFSKMWNLFLWKLHNLIYALFVDSSATPRKVGFEILFFRGCFQVSGIYGCTISANSTCSQLDAKRLTISLLPTKSDIRQTVRALRCRGIRDVLDYQGTMMPQKFDISIK